VAFAGNGSGSDPTRQVVALPQPETKIEREPLPALSTEYDAGAVITLCLQLNAEWFFTLAGWLQILADPASWEGSAADIENCIEQMANIDQLWSLGGGCVPIGVILWLAGGEVPPDWLACDGSLASQADYPALYDLLADTYGTPTETHFYLPDLRGSTAIGTGQGPGLTLRLLGDAGGLEDVTLAVSTMPAHTHIIHNHLPGLALAPGELPVSLPNPVPTVTGSQGGGGAHQNMPPWLALQAIIRAR